MNKKDLVGRIAVEARLTREQASRALEACIAGIQAGLQSGDRVTLSGFGAFAVLERRARRVRHPRNGGDLQIAARRVPRFAPSPELKSAVAGNQARPR